MTLRGWFTSWEIWWDTFWATITTTNPLDWPLSYIGWVCAGTFVGLIVVGLIAAAIEP